MNLRPFLALLDFVYTMVLDVTQDYRRRHVPQFIVALAAGLHGEAVLFLFVCRLKSN